MAEKSCSLTEFVGTAIGDTLGLVIANVDTALLDAMKLRSAIAPSAFSAPAPAQVRTLWRRTKR